MARLWKTKSNLDRIFKDRKGNKFALREAHSGFVWLSTGRGMKQIGRQEFNKYYTEVRRRRK